MQPSNTPSRRRVLRILGAGGLTGLSGCNLLKTDQSQAEPPTDTAISTPIDTPGETQTEIKTQEKEWEVAPLSHDKLIGAHYYPWYETNPAFDPWAQKTPKTPVLGEYDSSNENVINQHIKWALEHGINWFNVSWWGINSPEDRTLQENLLQAELGDSIQFSILYESTGQFGQSPNFDNAQTKSRLQEDFLYLEETFFNRPNYLDIDGRPVLYVYAVNTFTGDILSAFESAKSSIDSDPYLIASIANIDPSRRKMTIYKDWMTVFDAISPYSIYHGKSLFNYREFSGEKLTLEEYTDYSVNSFRNAQLAGEITDISVIPAVLPGFNNTFTRDGDSPVLERSQSAFRDMCGKIINLLDDTLKAILITSFNEWPETTAIEPAETWKETYLKIIKEEVAFANSQHIDPSVFNTLRLNFNKTIQPEGDSRELALVCTRLLLKSDTGDKIAEFDIGIPEAEPILIEGAYPTERTSSWGTFRWFGGVTERASILFDPELETPSIIEWTGIPMRSDEIEANIYFNSEQTDHVVFGERGPPETYTFSL